MMSSFQVYGNMDGNIKAWKVKDRVGVRSEQKTMVGIAYRSDVVTGGVKRLKIRRF
jgi:hypothetical protein